MTIKEIANLAGVSISTVSKIINNKDQNINPETRSRVLKIVKDYNYTPYEKHIYCKKLSDWGAVKKRFSDEPDAERYPACGTGERVQHFAV